ncbi:MAG: metal ABC transporter substrate-binding protein [Solirubrobacterales bacterium]
MKSPLRTTLAGTFNQSTPRRAATITATLAAAVIAGCGGDDDSGASSEGPGASGEATIVATTGVLADIAAEVAGDDAEVVQLIPDGVDVHGFAASAQDRALLDDAVLVVENGAGLEEGVPLDEVEAGRWALADEGSELIAFGSADVHGDEGESHEGEGEKHEGETHDEEGESHEGEGETVGEDAHDHSAGTGDPHVWMSPAFVAAAVPSLAEALAEADPANADEYRARADDYVERLESLDEEITDQLSGLPVAQRSLVTSHDAFSYFADRYDLTVIATPFPSSGPEAEPSAARLAEVQDAIVDSGVSAVFAQVSDNPEVLEAVARETGVEVVDELLVSSPGDAGSYEEMMRRNASLIAAGLG